MTRDLYTASPVVRPGWLRLDAVHTLYFEESGNPAGIPVVYLHGGPGAGLEPEDIDGVFVGHLMSRR